MMKLQTYAGVSFISTITIIYNAFNSRTQFYPAMVYLTTSKINLLLLLNMGLVILCILWQLVKRVFLGSLREAEIERLNEQSWREVMEILFTITIFRQEFSVSFLGMVAVLLLIKSLHWLAQKRIEFIETTPSVPTLSHIRIVSFMGFLLAVDTLLLYTCLKYLIQNWVPSVNLFFAFEYMILATTTISTFVKYVFYVKDMLMEGQWEKKAVYTFYLELIRDLLHLSMYLCFFLVIFMNYGLPLYLIRELYETFRNFKVRVADYIRYRKITSNMNDRFPDATPEELDVGDATCIICREEMITAKKLICGHLFHVHCLRSWLERQHTCPTCRALVVPTENGTAAAGGQRGIPREEHQQGAGVSSTSSQNETNGAAGDILSHHQARLQAASAAASIYEKSYVYPSANTFTWSQGYAFLPQVPTPSPDLGSSAESTSSGQSLQHHFPVLGGQTSFALPQIPYNTAHFQTSGTNFTSKEQSGDEQFRPGSQLEAQERFIRNQIEFLQGQLQRLQQQNLVCMDVHHGTPDHNQNTTVSSSSSVSDSGHHVEGEEHNTL
ncbi:Erad-associated e3 ubiquitin-protein ligase hrd1a [Thalictrum thalictroides]|uniref:RING-type E3 ubiquitin transferase n=1 Tax=Thalictrum thalictroides TaxID=46969 RepID=A0A7J6WNL6_THATH|nr:Erad-associated e3 ubiquitin-protein ligase hrd1a [Thalictrum thalictroides]